MSKNIKYLNSKQNDENWKILIHKTKVLFTSDGIDAIDQITLMVNQKLIASP